MSYYFFCLTVTLSADALLIRTVTDLECRPSQQDPRRLDLIERSVQRRPFSVHVLAVPNIKSWNLCHIRPELYSRHFQKHTCEVVTLRFPSPADVSEFRARFAKLQLLARTQGILSPWPQWDSGPSSDSRSAASLWTLPDTDCSTAPSSVFSAGFQASTIASSTAPPTVNEYPNVALTQVPTDATDFRGVVEKDGATLELPVRPRSGGTVPGKTSHAELTAESGPELPQKPEAVSIGHEETKRSPPDDAVTPPSTELTSTPQESAEAAVLEILDKDDRMHVREDQINEELREDLRFEGSCWTCTPPDVSADGHMEIPLTIDGFPVVIPVRHHYPLLPLLLPPPDPHFKAISPTAGVSDELVAKIFEVFTEALGFYILINGYLQVIVPDDFVYETGLARLPAEFGRLTVSLISCSESLCPTADHHETSAPAPALTQGVNPRAQPLATAAPASTPPPTATLRTEAPTLPQQLLTFGFKGIHGNTIRPVAKSGKGLKDRFEGKMGVLLAPNSPRGGAGSQKLLTLSTHVLSSFAAATNASLRESKDWISTIRLTSASSGEEVSADPNTLRAVYGHA